jgi:hypothetical protein
MDRSSSAPAINCAPRCGTGSLGCVCQFHESLTKEYRDSRRGLSSRPVEMLGSRAAGATVEDWARRDPPELFREPLSRTAQHKRTADEQRWLSAGKFLDAVYDLLRIG